MKDLKTLHKSLADLERAYREKLTQHIRELPNNRAASSSPRCFTVRSSQLENSGNLCARFYDFSAQYQEIIQRIEGTKFENIPIMITTILRDKRYHTQVRQHLREMWGTL